MPFTLIHGIIAYLFARKFSKNKNIRRLAFIGGLTPDIDGYPILFGDFAAYRKIHHEWLHPPFYGIIFGIAFSLIFCFYCRKKKIKFNFLHGVIALFAGHFLHSLVDIITSDWAINFLYPFANLYVGDIFNLQNYFLMNSLDLLISITAIALLFCSYKKDKSTFVELFRK